MLSLSVARRVSVFFNKGLLHPSPVKVFFIILCRTEHIFGPGLAIKARTETGLKNVLGYPQNEKNSCRVK